MFNSLKGHTNYTNQNKIISYFRTQTTLIMQFTVSVSFSPSLSPSLPLSLPSSLLLSLPPSFPPSLPPSLYLSLPFSLPSSFPPSLPPSLPLSISPPFSCLSLFSGTSKNWAWAAGGSFILAEIGTLHLEYQYLTQITGNPIYLEKVSI